MTVEELSSGTSMNIKRSAKESKLFNHSYARWNEKTIKIHQLVSRVTQHIGDGSGTLQIVLATWLLARKNNTDSKSPSDVSLALTGRQTKLNKNKNILFD